MSYGNSNTNSHIASLLNEFQPFFFTKQLVQNITNKETPLKKKKVETIYRPSKLDTLFWCYYILKNDMLLYEQHESNLSFVTEKKYKIELVEFIRENKSKLKGYKLASIDHIENQLANELKMDMPTFFSLCYINELQVVYFNDTCYYSTTPLEIPEQEVETNDFPLNDCEDSDYEDDRDILEYSIYEQHKRRANNNAEPNKHNREEKSFFMLKKDRKNGSYYLQKYKYNEISWNKYYKIDNISKPLKSVSSYSLTQLKDIAMIFNIDLTKKKKQDIYDELKKLIMIDLF
jgi:hypothetical protein